MTQPAPTSSSSSSSASNAGTPPNVGQGNNAEANKNPNAQQKQAQAAQVQSNGQPAQSGAQARAPGRRHTGIDSLLSQLRSTPSVEERANMALQALEDQYRTSNGDPERHDSYMHELHANRARIAQAIANG